MSQPLNVTNKLSKVDPQAASRQDLHVPRKLMAIPSHKPPISPDTQP
jgi:hypothetical protein